MSTQVDDLRIKLEAEAKGAESSIDSLIGKLSTLQTILRGTIRSTSRMGSSISGAGNSIAKKMGVDGLKETKVQLEQAQKPLVSFKQKLEETRKSIGNLGSEYANKGGKFGTADQINKEIEKIEAKLYNLEQNAGLKKFGSEAYNNLLEKGALLSNQLDSLKQKLADINSSKGSLGTEKESVDSELQEETKSATINFNGLNSALSQISEKVSVADVFRTIKSAISDTISVVGKATSAFHKFLRIIGTPLDTAFKKLGSSIKDFSLQNVGLVKSLTRVLKMLKLMVVRMALRGVISETKNAFTDLLNFSDKTANSFNKILTAIDYLAHTLAALAAPILNASSTFSGLGNIIDAIADKIVNLINKVNQLLSALLGHSTWIKATKQAKGYADGVKKAGKEVNKQLQAFDELNNLTTNDNSGGGSGGAGGGGYQELPIDKKWKDMAEWLKDMWKKGDGYELGRAIGEWLRDALNSIPWGKIQNFARRLGSFLATTLNGFFETPGLAKAIGNSLASAVNTALIFAEEFIKKFHFDSFGKFIGEAISEAIRGIHWTRLQNACKGLGEGIAKALNSLLSTGVLREIGYAIANLLLAAINFAFSLVTNVDWDLLGKELNAGIKRFLSTMSAVDETGLNGWQKLGTTISEAVKGVLKAINTVLGDPETRQMIGDAITDFFTSFDYKGIREALFTLAGNIVKMLGTAFSSAMKSDNFRAALGDIGLVFALIVGGKILQGISSMAVGALTTAWGMKMAGVLTTGASGGAVTSAIGNIVTKFTEFGGSIIGGLKTGVSTAAGGLQAFFTTTLGTAVAAILSYFSGAEIGKKIGTLIFPNDAELYAGYSGVTGTIKMTVEAVITLWDRMGERIATVNANAKQSVHNFCQSIGSLFGQAGEKIGQAVEKIINSVSKLQGLSIQSTLNNILPAGMRTGLQVVQAGSTINKIKNRFGKANGGIFAGGSWHPIQGYAGGGMPKSAEMFIAREDGLPEMVGKIGNHTAVANNDQIVASVSDGVYRAVRAAMNGTQSSGSANVNIELVGDTANLFKAIRKEGNEFQRRTGNPVFA